uniref:Uncharacterized protein n=1 Tax=Poecilia mexicana TaxID=48701 RepID=A0A3B3Y317_9TELE
MFFRLPTLTPGYIRLLQTQAFHNMPVTPPAEKTMPGMAMLLGALGIGMCSYSSRQLALHHRPSTRVLQWVGTHTDAGGPGAATRLQVRSPPKWSNSTQQGTPTAPTGIRC